MKRSITVTIAGQNFSLHSDNDEKVVKKLAASVDRRIRQINRAGRSFDSQKVAVLAALQLAEELHNEQEQAQAFKKEVRERGRALLKLLSRQARV